MLTSCNLRPPILGLVVGQHNTKAGLSEPAFAHCKKRAFAP